MAPTCTTSVARVRAIDAAYGLTRAQCLSLARLHDGWAAEWAHDAIMHKSNRWLACTYRRAARMVQA
jgi:hypothetical protein